MADDQPAIDPDETAPLVPSTNCVMVGRFDLQYNRLNSKHNTDVSTL